MPVLQMAGQPESYARAPRRVTVAELARWIGGADEEVAMAVEYATERQRSVQVGAFRLCPMRDGSVDVERVA